METSLEEVKVKDLLEKYSVSIGSLHEGGILLFNLGEARFLIDLCAQGGVGILGIEGFTLSGNEVRPELDLIADFSNISHDDGFSESSISGARKFLMLAGDRKDVFFEYCLCVRKG